jgi:hypothetical protein
MHGKSRLFNKPFGQRHRRDIPQSQWDRCREAMDYCSERHGSLSPCQGGAS